MKLKYKTKNFTCKTKSFTFEKLNVNLYLKYLHKLIMNISIYFTKEKSFTF